MTETLSSPAATRRPLPSSPSSFLPLALRLGLTPPPGCRNLPLPSSSFSEQGFCAEMRWSFALPFLAILNAVSGFTLTPGALPAAMLRHQPLLHLRPRFQLGGRRERAKGLDLVAGLDPGTEMPNLDAFYFTGVFVVAVSAGLLQYQSYGGKVGLGTYLSQGPEDKNWEARQARAAMESKAEMNQKAKGSFFANILPKLDFVEVYGQETETPAEPEEPQIDMEAVKELEAKLMKAVERQDFVEAEALRNKLLEMKGQDNTAQ